MKTYLSIIAVCVLLIGCREKSVLERRRDEELAVQNTEEGKKQVDFRYRRAVASEEHRTMFDVGDGVDQFEAWVLADEYRTFVYGGCGAVGVPQLKDGKWVVRVAVGSPPPEIKPPIVIDSKTGRLEHEGYLPLEDPAGWLTHPSPPNKAPVPTATSVTPAAYAPVAPAAAAAQL